jgi:hypothetical protein
MQKITWRDLFKFLSGAAFAAALFNFNFWRAGLSLPTAIGDTLPPSVLGTRAAILFVACLVFLVIGWRRTAERGNGPMRAAS